MPFTHGRLAYFKLATSDLSAFMDSIDFDHGSDVHETTTYGKTYKTRVGGLKEGSFSIGGLYDSTAVTGVETVIAPLVGTVALFEYGPEGNTATKVKYSGSVVVEKYTHSAPVGDMVRWKATLQTTDTVTKGVFP
jgi:hypothetical protein